MEFYSPLKTNLIINTLAVTGFEDSDTAILAERLEDSASHITGLYGEMVVGFNGKRAGRFVFRLNQTADWNRILSNLVSSAESGILIPVSVQFKDTLGGDIASGTEGYIPRPAAMNRGTNPNVAEWEIIVERLDLLHNGG